jgi:membrane protease YdiL (CAAX protease family)
MLWQIELPWSVFINFSVEILALGAIAVTWALFGLRIDPRSIGLTLGDRRRTLRGTALQLAIQGGLAVLYVASVIIVARTTHFRIPIRPTSLRDFDEVWQFALLAVLVGPLFEEILFRGMLLSALDWPGKRWASALVSTIIFAVPHWSPQGRLVPIIGAFVMGLILAWSFYRTRSIVTSFAVHAACNIGVIVKDLLMEYHPELIRRILGYE